VARSVDLADNVRRRGIRIKLNSVITALNWQEDMSALVRRIGPERWKAFQVLRIEGENDGKVEPLLITAEQFEAFVQRHAHLAAEGLAPVAEDNDAMQGSYVMIDPQGRFFTNELGRYVISEPILDVGVDAALAQVGWRHDKFIARGGVYDWRASPHPIVAIEGLDGCGKSTTVQLLADRLGARIIRNPPAELAKARKQADALPDGERRAWYLNANRLAMRQARGTQGPVVLDRSVASTLAFGAAARNQVACKDDLPPDFPLPNIVVLLAVPEDVRRARHAGRRGEVTTEEERLAADDAFRNRVLAGYANLCTVRVDATGTPEHVVEAILRDVHAWQLRVAARVHVQGGR
jgi:thymidylate kinase